MVLGAVEKLRWWTSVVAENPRRVVEDARFRVRRLIRNYRASPEAIVCFLHIPKTAGTAFFEPLALHFGSRHTYAPTLPRHHADGRIITLWDETPELDAVRTRIATRSRAIHCIGGHLPFGAHRLVDRPVRYVTLLRDPEERIISAFRHLQRRPEIAGGVPPEALNHLESLLDSGPPLGWMNDQTRMIIGTAKEVITREDLQRAKEILRRQFAVIGTQETFHASSAALRAAFSLDAPLPRPRNVAPADGYSVERRVREKIRRINHVDVELYAWISEQAPFFGIAAPEGVE